MKKPKQKVVKAWGVIDIQGKLLNDMMHRICFTTKERAEEVAKLWKGEAIPVTITYDL